MPTRSVDIMLSRPGIYVVVGCAHLLFVEVDGAGQCHQLKLSDYSRDGVLSPGGWSLDEIRVIHGPFARMPT